MPHKTSKAQLSPSVLLRKVIVVAFGEKGKQKITIEFLTVDLRQKWLKEWNMCTIVKASLSDYCPKLMELPLNSILDQTQLMHWFYQDFTSQMPL